MWAGAHGQQAELHNVSALQLPATPLAFAHVPKLITAANLYDDVACTSHSGNWVYTLWSPAVLMLCELPAAHPALASHQKKRCCFVGRASEQPS